MSDKAAGDEGHGPAVIRAAGIVLVRDHAGTPEVAVIHRPHRGDWSLPKGKCDADEHSAVAAVRETREETGFKVVLEAALTTQDYEVDSQPKSVSYWRAHIDSGHFHANDEVDELQWLNAADARELLTYPEDATTVAEALAIGPTVPLVLLRHGKAVSRSQWPGHDDDRPLASLGVDQAGRAAAILPCFGVTSVRSSPSKRCRDTVEPLGAALMTEVVLDQKWSEDYVEASLRKFFAHVNHSIETEPPGVICTHRPNLDTMAALLAESAPRPWAFVGGKLSPGQAWVLHRSTTESGLVRAISRLSL